MDYSSQLQLILELATYDYLLSSKWRSRAGGCSIPELLLLFRTIQKKWEAFDFQDKHRVSVGRIDVEFQNGMVGVVTSNQSLRLCRFSDISMKLWDERHWIEHPLSMDYITCYWDESQNLLIRPAYDIGWVFYKRGKDMTLFPN